MEHESAPFWTAQSLQWYLRAAAYEDYHDKTAQCLAPFVAEGTVCDLGCGPGRLSLSLLRHIPEITALDRDHAALEYLARDGAELPGLTVVEADAMNLPSDMVWDHLILSFFGRITVDDHLDYFLSHCRRQLISIVSAAPISSFSSTGVSARQKEFAPQVAEFLTQRRLSYRFIPMTLSFGQPLENMEEARAFVHHYSPADDREPEEAALRQRLEVLPDGRLYLPHRKEIGIFIINKE